MIVPALSVVVVRFAGGDAIRRSLDAILAQQVVGGVEVLVGFGPSAVPDAALRSDPRVTWVGVPSDDPAVARAAAVRAAHGSIIACTEDHCTPSVDWCARILDAHARHDAAAVGGAIDKTVPDSPHAWAAFLMEYGPFLPPVTAGPADRCSDCNVSYKRVALDAVSSVWSDVFRETSVHAALKDRGHRLWIDPAILVRQSRSIVSREFARERHAHGRIYGAQVAAQRSLVSRLGLAARTALIPVVFLTRARALLRARGRLSDVPGGTWPALVLASAAWAVGECRGLVTARGE